LVSVCQREAAAEARRAATHTFRSVSGLNADLKQAVTCQETARSKAKLKRTVVGHMRKLSKMPERVRSFFGSKTIRYAA